MAPPNGTTATVAGIPSVEKVLEPSPAAQLRKRVFGHAGITIGAGVLILIIVVALLAPLLAPYDPLDPFAVPPPPINEAFTVSIEWGIPGDAEPGSYRILLHGSEKQSGSNAEAFVAEAGPFEIVAP